MTAAMFAGGLVRVSQFNPLAAGDNRGFFGDSHTDGRVTGDCKSPGRAFDAIYAQNFSAPATATIHSGSSGESLAQTFTRYNGYSAGVRSGLSLAVFQESGNQALTGQDTVEAFGTTLYNGIVDVRADSPNAIILYETAFSFGRGPAPISPAEDDRQWDTRNTELRTQITNLAGVGITVYLAETDAIIKALQDGPDFTPSDLWFQRGDANEFHFTAEGNFAIAIGHFKALGYDVTTLDTSNMTQVTSEQRASIIATVAAL